MGRIAYQYCAAGMFKGETEADESPLEPGVYLLPAFCTMVSPPSEWPDDKWPRWDGNDWTIVDKPAPTNDNDPVVKLQAFLEQNPDVVALLQGKAAVPA